MKCPKCGYLGFESGDRCRNCGYDFSLAGGLDLPDLEIAPDRDRAGEPLLDLPIAATPSPDRVAEDRLRIAPPDPVPPPVVREPAPQAGSPAPPAHAREQTPAPEVDVAAGATGPAAPPMSRRDTVEALRRVADERTAKTATGATPTRLPLFAEPDDDDAPLITPPARPRAPLAVRRATPEVPRVRSEPRTMPPLDRTPAPTDEVRPAARAVVPEAADEPARPGARLMAGAIDVILLLGLDAVVLYFTLRIAGLSPAQVRILPKIPLAGFLLLLNGGYLAAFTAGGQTIGKMVGGLQVVSDNDDPVTIGRALLRTLLWGLEALPVGLGFLSIVISRDRQALHDRVAHTRVVTVSSS
ncbi:MAG: RDD family protein [Acidobacteriota bacterium]|nr:RDD family protein [Acidobacteriota bacterium]